jgi:hypothetical protein
VQCPDYQIVLQVAARIAQGLPDPRSMGGDVSRPRRVSEYLYSLICRIPPQLLVVRRLHYSVAVIVIVTTLSA